MKGVLYNENLISPIVDILGLITQELKRFGSMQWKVFVVPTI